VTSPSPAFWRGRRVFLTGHTGFKGGWLTLWLHELGAHVAGFALPADDVSLFAAARVASHCRHGLGDVRDLAAVQAAIAAFAPDIVMHLAAQPLVRLSYEAPVDTFATNVMGTANVLAASAHVPVVLIVTSDKVYAEQAIGRHDEGGRLGGRDPYSASKACAELVATAFPQNPQQRRATLRSGNVIGGGDWAADRLVPDFFRAVAARRPLTIRNEHAIRPWQHVLDPLRGYLLAAETLWAMSPPAMETWNFGPAAASEVSVGTIAQTLCTLWGDPASCVVEPQPGAPHEAPVLKLSSAKAGAELGWRPRWDLDAALFATVAWQKAFAVGADMAAFTRRQILDYGSA
jgi:CDP-glucose 4,6-dehydratase